MKAINIVILAAGKGKRMKSSLPKVLHHVGGRTMIEHVTLVAKKVRASQSVIVVPQEYSAIKETLKSNKLITNSLSFSVQAKQLGTGHALKTALSKINVKSGLLIVLNGDMPFISPNSIKHLIRLHQKQGASLTLLTAHIPGHGRDESQEKEKEKEKTKEKKSTKSDKKSSNKKHTK